MESRLTAMGGRLEGGGIKQKGERTHGHGQQCGDCEGEGGIRKINGNGKNTTKNNFLEVVEHFLIYLGGFL